MDVTPIVGVLKAVPPGPTVSVAVEVDPIIDGDLTLLETSNQNAPFGRSLTGINTTNDQSTKNDSSTHATGVEVDSVSDAAEQGREASKSAEEADEVIAAPRSLFNDSPSLPSIGA